jgi:hypothetical protein
MSACMSRNPEWLRKLAEAYFDPSVNRDLPLDDDDADEPDYNRADAVVLQVLELLWDDPEDCWRFIQIACELPLTVEQLGLLGAGVFEDLMDEVGELFIDRVERAVEGNAALQTVVDAAWTMRVTPHVATRLHALQSDAAATDNAARRSRWLAQQTGKS